MRKIYTFLVCTADGFYAGPNDEFDWPNTDAEFDRYSLDELGKADTIVFGRVTYEAMANYWPTPQAEKDDPETTAQMNDHPKIVISRTLERADWVNTRIVRDNVAEELTRLKEQPGKNIAIFGSSGLTVNLIRLGLVDELRIMVMPVVLGTGKSLFRTAEERFRLKLLSTRTFDNGNVLLTYRPETA